MLISIQSDQSLLNNICGTKSDQPNSDWIKTNNIPDPKTVPQYRSPAPKTIA